jgi:hypothetical protein
MPRVVQPAVCVGGGADAMNTRAAPGWLPHWLKPGFTCQSVCEPAWNQTFTGRGDGKACTSWLPRSSRPAAGVHLPARAPKRLAQPTEASLARGGEVMLMRLAVHIIRGSPCKTNMGGGGGRLENDRAALVLASLECLAFTADAQPADCSRVRRPRAPAAPGQNMRIHLTRLAQIVPDNSRALIEILSQNAVEGQKPRRAIWANPAQL